jgi:hypothetical protein
LGGCAAGDRGERGEECAPLVAGLPVLAGPPAGAAVGSAGRLEELWRVGGTVEGQALAAPAAFVASEGGKLAVVDYRLAEVVVVDGDGGWRGWRERRGQGPGELTMPVAGAWAGGRLAVFDIEQWWTRRGRRTPPIRTAG